jgi:FG-GAP repeat/Bacterial Ig-like domain (group 1)
MTEHSRPMTGTHGRRRWAALALAAAFVALFAAGAQAAQQNVTASDGAATDRFGWSVARAGDTLVVGAPHDDVSANFDQGSATVFVRSGGAWTQQQKLTASDGAANDRFGWSVALAGDTLVVGAPFDDVGASNQGSAYVFVRSGGVWTQQAKLTASDGAADDVFGDSVALAGDTLVAGAPEDSLGGNHFGSAYVFVRSGGVWTQQQKLTASDGGFGDRFGDSVALAGDTLVAGAPLDDVGAGNQGSAYVFVRSGGVWTQQQKVTASDGAVDDRFGSSVALTGDTLAVGAPSGGVRASFAQGSAYVFVRSGGAWTHEAKLTASDGAAGDSFGSAVALASDSALVGSPGDDVGANGDQGSATVFTRSSAVWTQQAKVTASDGAPGDDFGRSVALAGDSVVAGAPLDDFGANFDQGSVYVFGDPVPASVVLTPPSDTNVVGSTHTVTATVTDTGGNPVAGILVRFSVSGSVTTTGNCTTGADGTCSFSYTGPQLPGADSISAYADTDQDGVHDAVEPGGEATKAWELPASTPGSVSGGGTIEDAATNKIAFGFSAKNENQGLTGSCNVIDHAADVKLKCEDVTSFTITANQATIFGNATVNGVATTYRIDVVDNADPGKNADSFSIQTASGYSRGGTLTAGNVQVG